jgi:uncharacterized protein with PIN domain
MKLGSVKKSSLNKRGIRERINDGPRRVNMLSIERKNDKGEIEVAICPLCNLQVEFMGAPMIRCYTTGETYEQEEILWTPKSRVSKTTGYDAENIRGNEADDFLPNGVAAQEDRDE